MYKLSRIPNQVIRLSDNAVIPDTTVNYGDALLYQLWLGQGNTPDPVDPLPLVVREIDKRRLKKALHQMGLLDTVETVISQLGVEAQIDWNDADIIREDYPLVVALAVNMGLNSDTIFTLANSLE